jgi:hypothetical protein
MVTLAANPFCYVLGDEPMDEHLREERFVDADYGHWHSGVQVA